MSFYHVYFYNNTVYGPNHVRLGGVYDNFEDALDRLQYLIPDLQKNINKTVSNGKRIKQIEKIVVKERCINVRSG